MLKEEVGPKEEVDAEGGGWVQRRRLMLKEEVSAEEKVGAEGGGWC